ncbi:MAG: FAD-binding protein [Actinobacteria bacterium]|nr:FAD-binding protein [Actinomycetota bacterium]MCL6104462.1 FAD-binding protein [Actinomycetota bacterium]
MKQLARVAALVKQVPAPSQLALKNGRMLRDGVELEVDPYSRRAAAKAIELAQGGESVVFTMGPPSAVDVLLEMLACGANRAVHLCDPAFAGSDTLATARALAAALENEGPFDVILCGARSVDSDTGQLPAQLAQLLGLPFVPVVKELDVAQDSFVALLETDDGYRRVEGVFPVVLSVAERLCSPAKADRDMWLTPDLAFTSNRLSTIGLQELGILTSMVGVAGSPTSVGELRLDERHRKLHLADNVDNAIKLLRELGGFELNSFAENPANPAISSAIAEEISVPAREVWCVLMPEGGLEHQEIISVAGLVASRLNGSVTVVCPESSVSDEQGCLSHLDLKGADSILFLPGTEPEQWASYLIGITSVLATLPGMQRRGDEEMPLLPQSILVEGTEQGREVAARLAAAQGWGLVGDAVDFSISDEGRLVSWKPLFTGYVPVVSSSPTQIATLRPGVSTLRHFGELKASPQPLTHPMSADPTTFVKPSAVKTVDVIHLDSQVMSISKADVLVGIGIGVIPDDYRLLDPLLVSLKNLGLAAQLVATRKVTDRGWLPRSRQIGLTGRSVSPNLFISIGASGKFNHSVGFRSSKVVLAINSDYEAEIFKYADIGLVGDWRVIVPKLVAALAEY